MDTVNWMVSMVAFHERAYYVVMDERWMGMVMVHQGQWLKMVD